MFWINQFRVIPSAPSNSALHHYQLVRFHNSLLSHDVVFIRRQTTKCPLRVIDSDCQLEDSIDFPRFPLILHGHSNTRVTEAATRGLHFRAGDQMPNHWKVWPRLGNLLEESMAYWWPFEVACDKRELVLILRRNQYSTAQCCTVLKKLMTISCYWGCFKLGNPKNSAEARCMCSRWLQSWSDSQKKD